MLFGIVLAWSKLRDKQKVFINYLNNKKHGSNSIVHFLPGERFALLLAVLEMC